MLELGGVDSSLHLPSKNRFKSNLQHFQFCCFELSLGVQSLHSYLISMDVIDIYHNLSIKMIYLEKELKLTLEVQDLNRFYSTFLYNHLEILEIQ